MLVRDVKTHSARPLSGAQIRRGLSLPPSPSSKALAWATLGLAAAGLILASSESNGNRRAATKKATARQKKRKEAALHTQAWKARNAMNVASNSIDDLIHALRREDWGLE
jgi:hypothetical protein